MITRGRLNIKMSSYPYTDSHVKHKTVSPTVVSSTGESPYLGKAVFILRRGPDSALMVQRHLQEQWQPSSSFIYRKCKKEADACMLSRLSMILNQPTNYLASIWRVENYPWFHMKWITIGLQNYLLNIALTILRMIQIVSKCLYILLLRRIHWLEFLHLASCIDAGITYIMFLLIGNKCYNHKGCYREVQRSLCLNGKKQLVNEKTTTKTNKLSVQTLIESMELFHSHSCPYIN